MTAARPLRLLLVTDEMETGGTQRQISLLARSLDRRAFAPEVAYFRNRSFLVDELLAAGVPVTEIEKRSRFDPGFVYRLTAFLRRGRFDVVHAFAFTGELWTALASSFAGRPPLVSSVRGRYDGYSRLQWALKAWVARRSCCVVANSNAGADLASARTGVARDRFRIVHNGVLPPARTQGADLKASLGFSGTHTLALFVGRLVPGKNLRSLLRAVAGLGAAQPFALLVAGDGPQRAELEAEALSLGVADRVLFLGERRDVGDLLQAASFLVLPSLGEGLSNVVLEAMACGRPVVASDIPGNREALTHEVEGLLYSSGDVAALTRTLERMVKDAPLRLRLAQHALDRAKRDYSLDAMVRAMSSIYLGCARMASRPDVREAA